jgi:protease IV
MILRSLASGCIRKYLIYGIFLLSLFLLNTNSASYAAKQFNPFNSIIPGLPASQACNSFSPYINPVFSDIIPDPSFSYMIQNFDNKEDMNHFFLADLAGFLFSYSWIERMRGYDPDAGLFTIGKGFFFAETFGFGANYSFSKSKNNDFDKYKSLSLGLLFRPSAFISFGYTARDINNPEIFGEKTARSDVYSLSLKPHNYITLSIDAVKYEDRAFSKSDILLSAGLRFKYEISAFATINKDKDITFGISLPFGINSGGSSSFILDAYYSDISGITSSAFGATIAVGKTRSPLLETRRFLKIILNRPLNEARIESLFGKDEIIFYDLVKAIETAGKDTSVSGIILQIDSADMGFAQIQELREQIRQFRKKNKMIYAVLNVQGNKEYYLAAACDKIYYMPANVFAITGLMAEVFFFKGGLDKIGIKFESVSKGAYKSFPEPYTREHMSHEFKENMTVLISDLNNQYLDDIIYDRKISREKINELFNRGFLNPKEAMASGFIDEVEYPIDAEKKIVESAGTLELTVSLDDYIRERTIENYWGPKSEIAVIYVSGSIIHGESKGSDIVSAKTIGDETYYKALLEAFKDFRIKAVVIRVDSGGGSALASELMWHYLVRLKKEYKKPVIFSFGNVAASGGYYIACTGDHIFANTGSVTGSIGVVTGKLSLKELYSKLGINKDTIKMSEFADIFSEAKDMTAEERKVIEQGVEYVYNSFTEKVAAARHIEKDRVDKVAEGRVFTGSQAKNSGLVDSFGGLLAAIEMARKISNINDDYNIRHLPETSAPLMEFLGLKSTGFQFPGSAAFFQLFDLMEFKDENFLYYCPYKIVIR